MTSVLIVGIAKSGTSALYSAAKRALPNALSVYEPSQAYQLEYIRSSSAQNKIVKILYPALRDQQVDLSFFDRKVLIVRDPRDSIVSLLLYKPLLSDRFLDEAFVNDFVELLRKKEANPAGTAILDFIILLERYGHGFKSDAEHRRELQGAKRLLERYPDMHMIKYEDYIAGSLAELERYLGFSLQTQTSVSKHLSYNERAKESGGWRHWFTASDVDYFKDKLTPYMEQFGYESDWSLADRQSISPAHSSEYILSSVAKLRRLPNRFGRLRERSYYTQEYIEHLVSAAEDGAEGAMVELGLAHLFNYCSNASSAGYERWMGEAAARGNPVGLVHWGVAAEMGWVGNKHDAPGLFREAAAIRGNAPTKKLVSSTRDFYGQAPTAYTGNPLTLKLKKTLARAIGLRS